MSLGAGAVGAALGAIPFALLRAHARALGGATKLTTDVVAHNYRILVDTSLPWALGTTPYVPARMMDYGPWHAPPAFHAIQVLGAAVLVIGILFGGLAFFMKAIPSGIRFLGLIGFASLPLSAGAFLTSMMVMDHFSTRYLVAFLLMVPFALAPAAWVLKSRRFLVFLLPSLASAAVAGWLGYGPFVDGVRIRGALSVDDYHLGEALRAHHITCAVADYWVSYRLTLLYKEEIVVIPSHASQDRYLPYRRMCDGAPAYAYLFDPLRSEEPLARVEERLASSGVTFERLDVGTRTALLVVR